MTQWFVAQTEWNHERLAVKNLERQEFSAYCPIIECKRYGRLGPSMIEEPLFPTYVFVAFDPARDRWKCINGTAGVRCVLAMNPERPWPLPDGYVEKLRGAPQELQAMVETTWRFIANKTRLRVTQGRLRHHVGLYLSTRRGGRHRLLMNFFGRETVVVVDDAEVEDAGEMEPPARRLMRA